MNALREVTNYLGEEDTIEEPVTVIFVFGSKSTPRIEKAIELYKKGLGEIIWISGRSPVYEPDSFPEALNLAQFALQNEVPKDNLFVEPFSVTIPDNVKTSLNLMEKLGVIPKSIACVTSWFAQRRAFGHFKKFSPPATKIVRVNSTTLSAELSPDRWFTSRDGIALVFNEFIKMRTAYLLDTI